MTPRWELSQAELNEEKEREVVLNSLYPFIGTHALKAINRANVCGEKSAEKYLFL